MAVTNADILGWLNANPDASPELINQTMAEAGVSAAQYQSATGTPPPPVTQASSPEKFATLVQEATSPAVNTVAPTSTKVVGGPVQTNPAVSNADILGWFNANPNADTALINQTMQTAGVSPQQVSAALSSNPDVAKTYLTQQILGQGTANQWSGEGFGSAQANAADMAKILSSIGITDISQFGKVTKEVPTYDEFGTQIGTEKVETFGNKVTGQAVPNTYSERQTGNFFGGTFAGKGNTGYGVQFDASGKPVFYTQGASSSDIGSLMPLIQLGLMATGAGGLLGNALLGTTGTSIASSALGGGLLGGGLSAATGGDFLKGALTGAAGGAIAAYFSPTTGQVTSTPTADSVPLSYDDLGIDYSLANGTQMKPLTDMGGASGLQPGTSANLEGMGGAQGITLNLGAPSTTLANALATFGGVNPANLSDMGGAQGLTYQTPSGLVTQGGTLLTGGSTGNNNVIGETGINTAYNIGGDLGKTLANVDTGVYNPAGGLLSSTVTGINPDGTPVKPTTTTPPVDITNIPPSLISTLLGAVVAPNVFKPTTPTTKGVSIPTQGVPLNSQDYFNTIQQNYNRLLPAVPRDVATPLAQWYNSSYGA